MAGPWDDYKKPDAAGPWADYSTPRGMEHTESISPRAPRAPSKFADIETGFLSGLKDVGTGTLQRYFELTGNPKAEWMRRGVANNRAREATEEASNYQAPSIAHDIGRVGGTALPATALGYAMGPSLPSAFLGGALGGYTMPSASNVETGVNTAAGGLMGLGTAGAARIGFPSGASQPEHRAALAAGMREGLEYTGGQIGNRPIVQRAEAHAMWNPFTARSAIPQAERQADQLARSLLKKVGVPEAQIPQKAALTPEMLQKAKDLIGATYDKAFPPGKVVDLYTQKITPQTFADIANSKILVGDGERIVMDTTRRLNRVLTENNGRLPSEALQDTLRMIDDQLATPDLSNSASSVLKSMKDRLVDVIPDKASYKKAQLEFAQLKTAEDALRRSKNMGEGNINPAKLSKSVEQQMPGGVLYNKSNLADLARGAEQMSGVGALPDRSSGVPRLGDLTNAFTYYRHNNPLAKWGMLSPYRDPLEMSIRYLPYSYLESEVNK